MNSSEQDVITEVSGWLLSFREPMMATAAEEELVAEAHTMGRRLRSLLDGEAPSATSVVAEELPGQASADDLGGWRPIDSAPKDDPSRRS